MRDVFAAVFALAAHADFDEDEVRVDTLPDWFVQVCEGGAAADPFAVDGRAPSSIRSNGRA
ncbi:hypothetical protein [Streptomyces sp. JNUCC 63]